MKNGILVRVVGQSTLATVLVFSLGACTPSQERGLQEIERMAKNAAEAEAAEEALAGQKSVATAAKKSSARQPASARGVYVVQIGAFRVKENAERLHEKLASSGFAVEMRTLEHSKNGTLHLVRSAPIESKSEAEAKALELKEKFAGLETQVLRLPASL